MVNNILKVVCVLKTGGDFFPEYITHLYHSIKNNITLPFKFIVLTDIENDITAGLEIEQIQLKHCLPGWWSKLEIFQLVNGPVLYFDLDTIIFKNIDALIKKASKLQEDSFLMLRPFNDNRRKAGMWASGIMIFNGDFKFLLDNFLPYEDNHGYKGDQNYINEELWNKNVEIKSVQASRVGIRSYKRHCLKDIPKETNIICFHGKPRPHTIKHLWEGE